MILHGLKGTSENWITLPFSELSQEKKTLRIGRNKVQLFIIVYPFTFTGEELRYNYGFPHAEWRQNHEPSRSKSNREETVSKNKRSCKEDEPFNIRTIIELYPNYQANQRQRILAYLTKSEQNQTNKVEKNTKTHGTEGTEEQVPIRYAKLETGTPRPQQGHRKANLAKLRKTKLLNNHANQNVPRSFESSYSRLTELEERKPKTSLEARNDCVKPQKVSRNSENTHVFVKIWAKYGLFCTHPEMEAIWRFSCTTFLEVQRDSGFKNLLLKHRLRSV